MKRRTGAVSHANGQIWQRQGIVSEKLGSGKSVKES